MTRCDGSAESKVCMYSHRYSRVSRPTRELQVDGFGWPLHFTPPQCALCSSSTDFSVLHYSDREKAFTRSMNDVYTVRNAGLSRANSNNHV